jgi:hypothetical protein
MSPCDRFHAAIEQRLAGVTPPEESAALAEHCRTCRDCRLLLAADEELRAAGDAAEPDLAGLAEVRRAVLRQARQAPTRAARRAWPATGLAAAAALGSAAALVGVGFLAGRYTAVNPPSVASQDAPVVRGLVRAAQASQAVRDPLDSPFTFTNVRLAPAPGRDRLHLSFDVAAHLEMDRPLRDPLVAEVVAQTLRTGTAKLGSRLEAVEIAGRLAYPAVRHTLIAALREDPSPAVRAEALSRLSRAVPDRQVRAAVLQALGRESSVEVRLLAIDYLAASGLDRGSILRAAASGPQTMREAMIERVDQDTRGK